MSEKTKRFWWLKLRDDFFDQTVIKKLRRMAGGDTYTIIYLKMQLLSLRNDGVLLFENIEDTFEEELALRLDETTDNVQVTLLYLQKQNLIEIVNDNEYVLTEAVKNMGSECDSAARMRNMREKQRESASQCDALPSQSAHSNVTCDTEIRDKRKEIRDKNEDPLSSGDDGRVHFDYDSVVESFNSTCSSLPHIRGLNDQRRKAIRKAAAQVEEAGGFPALFAKVEASDFLTGRSGSWNGCGFDWILKPANLTKILEGNYDNRRDEPAPIEYAYPQPEDNLPIDIAEGDTLADILRKMDAQPVHIVGGTS